MDLDGFTRRYWLREVDEGHEFCGSLVLVRIIFLQETYFRKNRCREKLFSRESCCRQDNFLARNQFSRGPCCCRIFSHQNPLVKRKYFSLKRTCFHEDYSVARIFSHENPVVLRILFCKKSVFTRIQLSLEPFLAGILLRGSCYRKNFFFLGRNLFSLGSSREPWRLQSWFRHMNFMVSPAVFLFSLKHVTCFKGRNRITEKQSMVTKKKIQIFFS